MHDKVLSMLGLAARARGLVSGEFSVEKVVKSRQAFLVIVAEDASANSKKHYQDMCCFHQCKIHFYGSKESLGRAIGKEFRASVAIIDENFAKGIEKQLAAGLLGKEE